MKEIMPSFYPDFQCIADRCQDTCCNGWGIMIDEESLDKYKKLPGEFGEKVRNSLVSREDGVCFGLNQGKGCSLQTETGLCSLMLEVGEDALCQICRDHPRFYNWYGDYEETGLGLCCEEVSRLLLSLEKPLTLTMTEPETDQGDQVADAIFGLRNLLFDVIFDSEITPQEKLAELYQIVSNAQNQMYGDDLDGQVPPLAQDRLLEDMTLLEPIDQAWTDFLENLQKTWESTGENPEILELEMGNILAYLLYRHFPEASFDGELVTWLTWCVRSTQFVWMTYVNHWRQTGSLTQWDRITLLKNWSKQVEYSEDNVSTFFDQCSLICHPEHSEGSL